MNRGKVINVRQVLREYVSCSHKDMERFVVIIVVNGRALILQIQCHLNIGKHV
jgi:hypothetical protein